jgi:hypothetical protein
MGLQDGWEQCVMRQTRYDGSVARSVSFVGHELRLELDDGTSYLVQVVRLLAPVTMSPVLLVLTPPGDETVLKLHDRRAFCDLRAEDARDSPFGPQWSPERERLLCAYYPVDGGDRIAPYLYNPLRTPDAEPDFDGELTDEEEAAMLEAWLRIRARKEHEQEVAAYRFLRAWQGDRLPHLLGVASTVRPVASMDSLWPPTVHVRAILLEYLPASTTLRDLPTAGIALSSIPTICDSAVAITTDPAFYRVQNSDIRLDNFLVTPRPNGDGYRVVMIDLAMTRLLGEDEDEEDWKREKRERDYPGAVGCVVEAHLNRYERTKGVYRYDRIWEQPLLKAAAPLPEVRTLPYEAGPTESLRSETDDWMSGSLRA